MILSHKRDSSHFGSFLEGRMGQNFGFIISHKFKQGHWYILLEFKEDCLLEIIISPFIFYQFSPSLIFNFGRLQIVWAGGRLQQGEIYRPVDKTKIYTAANQIKSTLSQKVVNNICWNDGIDFNPRLRFFDVSILFNCYCVSNIFATAWPGVYKIRLWN